ncbi:hypothetical protein PPERSA_04697 [Pseudocohnilembus persalinus]|uniref:Uncharacterized protein n=1 Tax=Pseudocohnilembus persalinus TaxID=266149 RepID=A0A0V0R4I8_PSEPJ|nr:hypothetical protein PPERSA_04697 [Pseudocohnilembus persalinus]|eukprot:KRX09391.1 hypothetical protein PPERSA_04697 [Pseudocohnilembus persalinus]
MSKKYQSVPQKEIELTQKQQEEYAFLKSQEHLHSKFTHDSNHIKNSHPDMTPVVIERYEKKFKRVKEWNEGNRFLFLQQDKALHFMIKTQEQVQVPKGDKLWFFVYRNGQPKEVFPQAVIGTLHRRYANPDGTLYIYYTDVNIFPQQERQMIILQIIAVIFGLIYAYLYFFGGSTSSQEQFQDKNH